MEYLTLECNKCHHIWDVPEFDDDGNEYDGPDIYRCPVCFGRNFGEYIEEEE